MAEKYSFIVVKYPQVDTAKAALAVLKELSKDKVVKLKDAVSVTKTAKGKIKLHQTKDDSAGKGFVKGGLIGILFAALFGPVGWIAAGALAGTAFAMFDRGIKNKLLKELGEKMTPTESALAVLVEHADWATLKERMQAHNFHGEVVVSEMMPEDLAEWEKLTEDDKVVASVPEEMEIPAPAAVVAEVAAEPAAAAAGVAAAAGLAAVEAAAEPGVQRPKGLEYIEGVGSAYSQKLSEAGITTVEALLDKGATPQGRKELADTTGISEKLILRWVNMADLFRIKGVGQEYAELLEAAGVDTVPELAQRAPANLLAKMETANEQKKLVRRLPVLSQVESWVEQAKSLPRVITH
jgi:uncharacterized membrane protein